MRLLGLLLAATLAGASAAAAQADAPFQLRRGDVLVEEVPTGNTWGTRSYVIGDLRTRQAAVVDCGGNFTGAQAVLDRHGLQLVALLLTHAHIDHVMGLPDARAAAPGARVHLHAGDAELYASFGLPLPGPLPTAASRVLPLAGKLAAAAGVGRFNLPPVDAWLEDGATVAVGAVQLRVMHTPGHSRGHVVLYEADARVLFGGDLLIGRGVGRWDMPGGDASAVSASAARTCAALPADATVLSGHAGALTVATYRRINARCAAPEATQRSRDAEL